MHMPGACQPRKHGHVLALNRRVVAGPAWSRYPDGRRGPYHGRVRAARGVWSRGWGWGWLVQRDTVRDDGRHGFVKCHNDLVVFASAEDASEFRPKCTRFLTELDDSAAVWSKPNQLGLLAVNVFLLAVIHSERIPSRRVSSPPRETCPGREPTLCSWADRWSGHPQAGSYYC